MKVTKRITIKESKLIRPSLLLTLLIPMAFAFTIQPQTRLLQRQLFASNDDKEENFLFNLLNYRRRRKEDKVQPIPLEDGEEFPKETKSRFSDLFSGMPGINEILKDDEEEVVKKEPKSAAKANEEWFDEVRQDIMKDYEDMWAETRDNLEEQRRQDPSSVPSNAEALLKSVLKQEMAREIEEAKDKVAQDRLQEHERRNREMLEERGTDEEPSDLLKALIRKSDEEYEQQEAERRRLEEYLQFEKEIKEMSSERQPATDFDVNKLFEKPASDDYEPASMKEWQMFRSIASRMGFSDQSIDRKDKKIILEQLAQWKDYMAKEESIRSSSGLARGPKLPFEWQELETEEDRIREIAASKQIDRNEARKEVNRRAIEALESIAMKSTEVRREKLRKEIDFLKSSLEARDYLDVDEADQEESFGSEPVDLSDVFSRETGKQSAPSRTPVDSYTEAGDQRASKPQVPDTPFFSDARTEDFEASGYRERPVAPPKTPFFQDNEEEPFSPAEVSGGKLGTLKEQKLNAMYRRAGARTDEEKARIRQQWEDFQSYESQQRDMSGLSGVQESDETQSDVDVSAYMREDGDFDAEKVLASIGPRPKRRSKEPRSDSEEEAPIVSRKDVNDSLYRSVSAVGGGRYKDDPQKEAEQKQAFVSFRQREEELRQNLDAAAVEDTDVPPEAEDIDQYAADVMQNLGPRPVVKRTPRIDERGFSDQGGVLSYESDEDDDDDLGDTAESRVGQSEEQESEFLLGPDAPEWLKQEQAISSMPGRRKRTFLTTNVEDAFEDTDYDKNMRQLAEYERRRAGKTAKVGIDISDALGHGSDDYADYKYADKSRSFYDGRWGEANYNTRRNDMLDYKELELIEVTRLMDTKDSVYATGASRYTARINKPFKDFGAIFRLEGVLVDTIALQRKAWTYLAKTNRFRMPDESETRRASALRPAKAIREIFYWTDDIFEAHRIAESYRDVLSGVFDEWATSEGISIDFSAHISPKKVVDDKLDSSGGSRDVDFRKFHSEEEQLRENRNAWNLVAEKLGLRAPTADETREALNCTPDIAVTRIFRWTMDQVEADILEKLFVQALTTGDLVEYEDSSTMIEVKGSLSRDQMLNIQFDAWSQTAARFGFEPPLPDEVLSAFVINDTQTAIRDGFGWSNDPSTVLDVAKTYESILGRLIHGNERGGAGLESPGVSSIDSAINSAQTEQPMAASDDLYRVYEVAWKLVANEFGLPLPAPEKILSSIQLEPKESIKRLFRWSYDLDRISEITNSFRRALANASSKAANKNVVLPKVEDAPKQESRQFTEADRFRIVKEAWGAVARNNGFIEPSIDEIHFSLSFGPAEAVMSAFQWTLDHDLVSSIVEQYKEQVRKRTRSLPKVPIDESPAKEVPLVQSIPGGREWVKSLLEVDMSCAVVSNFNSMQVATLLKFAGLSDLLPSDRWVTDENQYRTEEDGLLGAVLRVERRPDHCVLFDCSPESPLDAHANDMQCVGIIGPYPRYELLSADMTAASFDELTALNIRRLFGERIADEPMLDLQQALPTPEKKVKTMIFYDDD